MGSHGGKREGAGRPRKADKERVRRLGINAIKKVYGSVEAYYMHIAKQSKESLPHLKLLQEYVYGKPSDHIIFDQEPKEAELDLSTLTDEELDVLSKLYGRNDTDTADTPN